MEKLYIAFSDTKKKTTHPSILIQLNQHLWQTLSFKFFRANVMDYEVQISLCTTLSMSRKHWQFKNVISRCMKHKNLQHNKALNKPRLLKKKKSHKTHKDLHTWPGQTQLDECFTTPQTIHYFYLISASFFGKKSRFEKAFTFKQAHVISVERHHDTTIKSHFPFKHFRSCVARE